VLSISFADKKYAMKKTALSVLLILLLASFSKAQFTRYIIKFKNKGNSTYSFDNPSSYLSQRALARRTRYAIPIDSTDLPLSPVYISQVASIPHVSILNASKWLNQVSIQTTDANAIDAINNLPFVQRVSGIASRTINGKESKISANEVTRGLPHSSKMQSSNDYYDYGANSANEIGMHKGAFLHNIGLRGETMQIALIDAGFYNYNTLKVFDSLNANGQVLETWDFVAGNASVTEDNAHGMSCLSAIAANIPGQFVGMAPKTNFCLYRTEDVSSEYPIEEHNWVCAAERADSAGNDIISSSLGYSTFDNASLNHNYADLDGNTTMAAIGADLAAKKGILVFIAAGNEGESSWHYIMTPADADSVLTVGAVDINGNKASFSSFGPAADGRIKPDVVTIGVNTVIATAYNTIATSQGTSYACPKMAGLGTCLWQGFPEFSNMKIWNVIRESGSKASHPTDSLGFGIPDMKLAFTKLLTEFAIARSSANNCTATVNWTSKDVSSMKYEIERKTSVDADYVKIGELSAQAGNSLSVHAYTFANSITGINAGSILYRVKQIVDTTSEGFTAVYIDTTSLTLNNNCDTTSPSTNFANHLSIAPNPVVNNTLNLTVESINAIPSVLINIYDIDGRLMLQRKESKTSGKIIYSIPVSALAKGKYTVTVYASQSRFGTVKMLKL
jgi:serine protease AprX